ncbi:unnamed protein product [Orchesella dallaii]|uniref:BTB domain-containing protein n=1 Tax=Orchesella dallaii TaxID=48710 RepID=A0ABP1QFI3_9HEXA
MRPILAHSAKSTEGQCKIGQTSWAQFESSTDGNVSKVSQASSKEVYNFARHLLVYACQFPVKPRTLYHYYVPEMDELQLGRPVLQGSPLFEGPCGTKWQVTTTFIRWIGVTRWVSLYLTRRDKIETSSMNIQCEFRIVDKNRNVLRSMKMKKMITEDNWLNVEVHITFLNLHLESDFAKLLEYNKPQVTVASPKVEPVEMLTKPPETDKTTKEEGNVPTLTKPPFIPSSVFYVEEDDQVAVWYNDVFLVHTSRKLLLEMSNLYNDSVEKWWSRIDIFAADGERPSEPVVWQCLQYLHQRNCEYLHAGSYDEIFELFVFAENMKMDSLQRDCIIELFSRVDCNNAAMHIMFTTEYFNWVSQNTLEQFRTFYRKNIRTITQTDGFKSLLVAEDDSLKDLLVRIAWDPDFSFDSAGSSISGEESDYDMLSDIDEDWQIDND